MDENISDNKPDCGQRDGGRYDVPSAAAILHTNDLAGQVEWDVPADVLAGYNAWLISQGRLEAQRPDQLAAGRAEDETELRLFFNRGRP